MSRASRTRAYNKAFDETEWLTVVGAVKGSDNLWRVGAAVISAYPGRPGRVCLMRTTGFGDKSDFAQRNFPKGAIDDMKAFVEGRATSHDKRGALIAAAPELLEALEALIGEFDYDLRIPLVEKARAAIAKAKGESK